MRLRRSTIFLAVAFAALLLVIAASAFAVWRNATVAQMRVAEPHSAHMRAGSALASIRANVYSTGILARDYLLDVDASHVQQYIDQFQTIRDSTQQAFQTLGASSQDDLQRQALRRLRSELELYWDPTEIMLDWTPEEKRAQRAQVLRQRVRRRQDIFALAGQVEKLITDNFIRERARLTTADRDFRNSLGWITGIALLLSSCIAALALSRMNSLERASQFAQAELRRLSVQLRTAQEQERKYLSRELHDQVGQMSTGLRMELASMARAYADAERSFAGRIARAKGSVEQTLRVVRNIAMLLRPSILDDLGLTPALAWHMKEFSRASGINIRADIDATVDSVPDPHRTCLYRIVQEALTNCARHRLARNVDVSLRVQDGWTVGSIVDDGRGFTASKRKGLGILGMEERVLELGGTVRVVTSPWARNTGRNSAAVAERPEVITHSQPDLEQPPDRAKSAEGFGLTAYPRCALRFPESGATIRGESI